MDKNINTLQPNVTVVMPAYNAEKHLKQAIDSILNQTFKNFIFLIINDGSSDDTEKIIFSYTGTGTLFSCFLPPRQAWKFGGTPPSTSLPPFTPPRTPRLRGLQSASLSGYEPSDGKPVRLSAQRWQACQVIGILAVLWWTCKSVSPKPATMAL